MFIDEVPSMDPGLLPLIDAFNGLKVIVVGEVMLDSYLEGATGRFCQEAPVPIVTLSERRDVPGGAANVAVNVHELGGRVSLLSVLGADHESHLLQHALQIRGVSGEHLLACSDRRTLTKQRVFAARQMLLRLDHGTTTAIDLPTEEILLERLTALYPDSDAVIISDYDYGVLTPRIIRAIAQLQARHPRIVVADSRRLPVFRDVGVTAVKPNFAEAAQLLGAGALEGCRARADDIMRYSEPILELSGARIAAVTLDNEGAVFFERNAKPYRTYARAFRHGFVVGAGDTFISGLTLALAARASTPAAAEIASAAAAVAVSKERTATCKAHELRDYVGAQGKLINDRRLSACVEMYREQGRTIVFTNGCFDILHRGHVTFLNRAKGLGDVLILGVNSDDSIRRLKGPTRPINSMEDRIQVLAALTCIDHLVVFDEDTPANLIRAVRPDIFVKGGDYTRDRLPEAALVEEFGGVVEILPYLQDRSTTGIIERIREVNMESRSMDGEAQ
jgi:D-beta-D-heptose 7-phosphate kinase/D-beta-D-heptose 1-phosphate adenosyltransferase